MNIEFYSLLNSFYFINVCYIEWKIYLFLWGPAISRFKCPESLATGFENSVLSRLMLIQNFPTYRGGYQRKCRILNTGLGIETGKFQNIKKINSLIFYLFIGYK
jgi:hypothetical protein